MNKALLFTIVLIFTGCTTSIKSSSNHLELVKRSNETILNSDGDTSYMQYGLFHIKSHTDEKETPIKNTSISIFGLKIGTKYNEDDIKGVQTKSYSVKDEYYHFFNLPSDYYPLSQVYVYVVPSTNLISKIELSMHPKVDVYECKQAKNDYLLKMYEKYGGKLSNQPNMNSTTGMKVFNTSNYKESSSYGTLTVDEVIISGACSDLLHRYDLRIYKDSLSEQRNHEMKVLKTHAKNSAFENIFQ